MRHSIPWTRLFVEGITILTSILAAFAIDAWWEGVGARRAAREQLTSVAEELAATKPALLAQLEVQERVSRAAAELMTLLDAAPPGGTFSAADTLWSAVLYIPTVQPSTSATRALIGSGALGYIHDADLRDSLAVWPDRVVNTMRNQEESWRFVVEELSPAARTLGDIRAAFPMLAPWFRKALPSGRQATQVQMAYSQELSNLLAERQMNAELSADDYSDLLGRIDALLAAVRNELGVPPP